MELIDIKLKNGCVLICLAGMDDSIGKLWMIDAVREKLGLQCYGAMFDIRLALHASITPIKIISGIDLYARLVCKHS